VEGAFVLGRLAPGNYAFTVLSSENVVQTIPFAAPADLSNPLLATIETNGLLLLRLNGIGRIIYVIQASTDWLVGLRSAPPCPDCASHSDKPNGREAPSINCRGSTALLELPNQGNQCNSPYDAQYPLTS